MVIASVSGPLTIGAAVVGALILLVFLFQVEREIEAREEESPPGEGEL